MKKGDRYFKAGYLVDETPMTWAYLWEVTTVNKNGIYLRCIEKHCEGLREHVRPPKMPKDLGFRKSKNKALRAMLPDMREDMRDWGADTDNPDAGRYVARLRAAIGRIKALKGD